MEKEDRPQSEALPFYVKIDFQVIYFQGKSNFQRDTKSKVFFCWYKQKKNGNTRYEQ